MKLVLFVFFVFFVASSVKSESCYRTTIWYSVEDGCKCEDANGERTHVDNDGVFNDIFAKLNRRKPKCATDVCNDGLLHEGFYCGVGSCNVVGSNCDRGCWGGNDYSNSVKRFMERYGNVVKKARGVDFWQNLI